MKKKLAAILLMCGMSVLTACGVSSLAQTNSESLENQVEITKEQENAQEAKEESNHYPITISTFNYAKEPVEVTFEKTPEKVIAAWQNSVETLLALGLEDRIIATIGVKEGDISPHLQEAYQKIKDREFNDFTDTNVAMTKEVAVMMQPDFILAWKSTFSEKSLGDVSYWHQNGINTYMALNSNDISTNRTIENEYQDILTIGEIFDVEEKAKDLVDEMKDAVDKATKIVEGQQEKKSVLIIEGTGDKIRVYDKTTLAGDMVIKMGGNLLETEGQIGSEDLINLNPDVIFAIHMDGYGEDAGATIVESIMCNPAYSSLNVVQNSQVFPINLSDVYTSGIRTIDGLNAIGKALYPELY